MPTVKVDVDKINNVLGPLSKTLLEQLNTAVSSASRVYYPSGEFGWSKLVGDMKDCYYNVRTYNNWLQNLSTSMNNAITSNTEVLGDITIDPVEKRI